MGDCVHLDPNDNDPCRDYEAQSGKWGQCKEFKEKEVSRSLSHDAMIEMVKDLQDEPREEEYNAK